MPLWSSLRATKTPPRRPLMSDVLRLDDFPYNGPPARLHEGLDVSFQDVPYLVVPALTNRPIVHLAVDCEGVEWHMSSSTRIYARTRCGMQVYADRRCMSWTAPCKRCFPDGES